MNITNPLELILSGQMPLDFNWNRDTHVNSAIPKQIPPEPSAGLLSKITIDDEALRDGLHGVSEYPRVEEMFKYVQLASQLGIKLMTVGIYSGTGVVDKTIKKLLIKMAKKTPKIKPIILSLATAESINWAAACNRLNPRLQVLIFMGSSPSRIMAESWTKDYVLDKLAWAIKTAKKKYKLKVIGATEHTTQTPPDFLREIIKTQVVNGIDYFCIADTIGSARPVGVYRIVKFVKRCLKEFGGENIAIDWHGHRDIGFSEVNVMTAISAGVSRVHLVPWGYGERAGNSSLEVFLINASNILQEHGFKNRWDLSKLTELLTVYAKITGNQEPYFGCLGKSAFKTSLGIHTSAILKAKEIALLAEQKGILGICEKLTTMARTVYSGIDPGLIGRELQINIGPWSGESTVRLWSSLNKKPIPSDKQITNVLDTAKRLRRLLTEKEISSLLSGNGY